MGQGRATTGRRDGARQNTTVPTTGALLGFSAGVVSIRFIPSLPPDWIIIPGGVVALGLVILGAVRWRRLIIPAALVAGVCWGLWTASAAMSDWLPHALQKKDIELTGTVVGPVVSRSRGARFEFRVASAERYGRPVAAPERVRLTSYDDALVPDVGRPWRLVVRLKRPRGLVNFGSAFHYESWLLQAGLGATGYVVRGSPLGPPVASGGLSGVFERVEKIRRGFPEFIAGSLDNPRYTAVLSALTVGRRDGLNDDDWVLLRDTGTAHLVAISGLHIGLLALIAGGLIARLWRLSVFPCRWLPSPVAAAVAAAVAGTVYAMLAGFTLPTRRALCMLLVGVVALVARRPSRVAHMLAISLALILAFDPMAPFSASFWLSFSAVTILAMMVVGNRGGGVDSGESASRHYRIPLAWCRAQLWLLVGMLPVLLVAFHQVSLVAPPANLVAVPVIGMMVVPMALTALVVWLAGLETPAGFILEGAGVLLHWTWTLLQWLAALPLATWVSGAPSIMALIIAGIGLIVIAQGRAAPASFLGVVLLLPLLLDSRGPPPQGTFDVVLLDSGQGLSVLVRTHRHAMVYDTGAAFPGGLDLGEAVVVPELRRHGLDSLGLLVTSHGDNDHIGGARAVARAIGIEGYLTGAPGSPLGPTAGRPCRAGQSWRWDGVTFTVLWPRDLRPYSGNDASCVIRVESIHGSILLSGDIESASEGTLAREYGASLRSDVLLVPHHGSRTSSSDGFLDVVRPRLGLVSAGYLNRFGHPHPEVTMRYGARGIPLLNTAREGAVSIAFRAGGIRLRGARTAVAAFWIEPGRPDYVELGQSIVRHRTPVIKSDGH